MAANFEMGGDVVYNCTRKGFMPNPTLIRCVYNTTTNTTSWNDTVPTCEGKKLKNKQRICVSKTKLTASYGRKKKILLVS